MIKYLLPILFLSLTAQADEIGLRLNSAISPTDTALVQFPPGDHGPGTGYDGKMVNLFYDYEPHTNFYVEGALGYRSYSDVFQYSSMDYELSPGLKVEAGYFVFKLSEGFAYMPENSFDPTTYEGYQKFDFVTHLTLGLKDPTTGIGIYLDRSHYSNGNSTNNPSINYAGFMIVFPIGGKK